MNHAHESQICVRHWRGSGSRHGDWSQTGVRKCDNVRSREQISAGTVRHEPCTLGCSDFDFFSHFEV
jgi:hypothetical protein